MAWVGDTLPYLLLSRHNVSREQLSPGGGCRGPQPWPTGLTPHRPSPTVPRLPGHVHMTFRDSKLTTPPIFTCSQVASLKQVKEPSALTRESGEKSHRQWKCSSRPGELPPSRDSTVLRGPAPPCRAAGQAGPEQPHSCTSEQRPIRPERANAW